MRSTQPNRVSRAGILLSRAGKPIRIGRVHTPLPVAPEDASFSGRESSEFGVWTGRSITVEFPPTLPVAIEDASVSGRESSEFGVCTGRSIIASTALRTLTMGTFLIIPFFDNGVDGQQPNEPPPIAPLPIKSGMYRLPNVWGAL